MGEPLLNYDVVLRSLAILNHPKGRNIGIRHITVSMCGIVPAIKKLAGQSLQPRLAVSLNAPSDELRTQLMPVNVRFPISELLDGFSCNVNLIEHNPYPGCKYQGSSSERINSFASILDKAGIETVTRFRMGRDINAACGQLGIYKN